MIGRALMLGLALVASSTDEVFRLAQDGRLSEAAARVESARFTPVDRHHILGYLAVRARDHRRAASELERAVALDPRRRSAWLYLGVARYHLGLLEASRAALGRAEAAGRNLPGYYALRARTERLTGTATTAWRTLQAGSSRFEADPGLLREQVSLLIEIGAPEVALDRTERLFRVTARPLEDRVWVARALLEAGALERAAQVLEAALAWAADAEGGSEPSPMAIRAQLAWVHAERGRPWTAARLLDPLRTGSVAYAYEAADQYRLSGEPERALGANRFVDDPVRRAAQRLLILVDAGALDQAAALGARVSPDELDAVGKYALAFALAHTGQPEAARGWLARIRDRAAVPGVDALLEQLGASEDRVPSQGDR